MFRYVFKEFLRSPWREPGPSEWNESMYDELLNEIGKISFPEPKQKAGILLCGPTQSGKSSLINSVISICKGRPANVTPAMFSLGSLSYQYLRFYGCGRLSNLVITDTTGLLAAQGRGLNVQDVLNCLKGRIKNGYTFKDQPIASKSMFYNSEPMEEDESQCLVLVIDAILLKDLSVKYTNKIKEIVTDMHENGYPIVLILTKIDQVYPYLKGDITYMFKSSIVHETVQKASKLLGFQERDIHPVVNFTEEITLNEIKSIPVLLALRQVMHYIEDRITQIKFFKQLEKNA